MLERRTGFLKGGMMAGEVSTSAAMRRMIHGYQVSQALYVAATLGIADLLIGGPVRVEELAEATKTHASSLHRMLRLLASQEVFAEDEAGRFGLTPLAECLRSNVPGSQRATAINMVGPSFWSSWGDLVTTIKTGERAFDRVHGVDRWTYLAQYPEEGARFDRARTALAAQECSTVVAAYDFSGCGVVADIGGGEGLLLSTILTAHPGMRGIFFDQPRTIARASDLLASTKVADRCRIEGGDFFESVPSGADVYLLKHIIHDWDDDQALAILKHCRAAMTDASKLLIAEQVVQAGNGPDFTKFIDVVMMVMNGGRQRTIDEYHRILAAAGLRLSNVISTGGSHSLIEAVRA